MPSWAIDTTIPRTSGLLSNGMLAEMIVKAPFIRPEAPIPATARPTINMFESTATPQRSDPNSKRATKAKKVYLELQYV